MADQPTLTTPEFISKLPRYAQDWIHHAVSEIEHLRQRAAVAERLSASGPSEVRAGMGGWSSEKDLVTLPPRTEIIFATGPGRDETLSFRMPSTCDQGWIEVSAAGGAATILARPGASNVLYLRAHTS
jgi:hypothetical protein